MDLETQNLDGVSDDMCCEFTAYNDQTFSCSLYKGSKTAAQNFKFHPNEQFSAWVFKH